MSVCSLGRSCHFLQKRKLQSILFRSCHNQNKYKDVLRDYVRKVLERPLPLGVGALVVGFLQIKRIRDRETRQERVREKEGVVGVADDWQVEAITKLPLRHVSRLWGWLNNLYLPMWARNSVLGLYVRNFGCQLNEADCEDLAQFNNLGEFFRRRLKSSCRPIDETAPLVSPCDGRVLHFGLVDPETGIIEQVKGVTYSLKSFLGPLSPCLVVSPATPLLKLRPGHRLFQCVLYLAPGDYHCFHSPTTWTIHARRHFPGHLLSVNPRVARWLPRLFELNERVVCLGEWEHGFFSLVAVGATNVGSIKINFDSDLETNKSKLEKKTFHQKRFHDTVVKKGDYFGEFNLGSTIVLVFEAPEDLALNLKHEQIVKMGRPIVIQSPTVKTED